MNEQIDVSEKKYWSREHHWIYQSVFRCLERKSNYKFEATNMFYLNKRHKKTYILILVIDRGNDVRIT